MNGAHLLCTGRFSRPSSEVAWHPGRWKRRRSPAPPTSGATLVVQDSAGRGHREAAHLAMSVSLTMSEKEPKKATASAPTAPKGRKEEKLLSAFQLQRENKVTVGIVVLHSEQSTCTDRCHRGCPTSDPTACTAPSPPAAAQLVSDL